MDYDLKYKSVDAPSRSQHHQPPPCRQQHQSSTLTYFTQQAIRAGYMAPHSGNALDHFQHQPANLHVAMRREIENPTIMREAIMREIEKERIREEIIAEEMTRRRMLEYEVRRELLMERQLAKLSGEGFPPFPSPVMSFSPTLPFLKQQSDARCIEERITRSLEGKMGKEISVSGLGARNEIRRLDIVPFEERISEIPFQQRSVEPKVSALKPVSHSVERMISELQPSLESSKEKDRIILLVFSFKLRGAYNMMVNLSKEQLKKGVICSSAGNHAQGVALAAQRLGCNAVIVMPVTTPDIKWTSVKRLGANVVLMGDAYDEAQAYAKKRAEEEGRIFIPPFDHPDIIVGQGTIGMEINRQLKDKIHAIFVPVGGGGLIAGIAAFMKRVAPHIKVIGVEPSDANAMALSLHYGQRVMLDQVGRFADGVAVKVVGEETFRLCKELIDGVVLVNRDAICASIKDMFEEKRSILEPAGALALAGAEAYCKYYGLKDENVIAITSGANMNFDRLRLISELADVGRKREAVLVTFMPEEPGSFKRFCEQVSTTMKFTEVKYRYNSGNEKAQVLYSVGIQEESEAEALMERMKSVQLHTVNLTKNDLVKDHLRHLMGGRSNLQNELLCRFTFPEKPGALLKFLDSFSPRWNISLMHYRGQGQIGANVLVGIQVPEAEFDEFQGQAANLGFEYVVESLNDAFKLIMH